MFSTKTSSFITMDMESPFENEGEKAFRDLESAVIKEVSTRQHTVIATGGGAVTIPENHDIMRQNGMSKGAWNRYAAKGKTHYDI